MFSSLMKQKIKGKNCAVFYFAGKRIFFFYNHDVITWEIFYKLFSNYYRAMSRWKGREQGLCR